MVLLYVFNDFYEIPAVNTGATHDIKLFLKNNLKTSIWDSILDPVGSKNTSGETSGIPLECAGSSM